MKLVKAGEDIPRRCEIEINKDGEAFLPKLIETEDKPKGKEKKPTFLNDTGRDIPMGHFFWSLAIGKPKDLAPLIET